ncbi:MAG: TerC family protein [Aureibaculum sp.]|nr:TerC family protein [Aureibaculum sp.]
MDLFLQLDTWIALLTLTFLEIILGIDNIIFISITAGKLPQESQKKATRLGLLLAMVFRIVLLLGVSYLIAMKNPFLSFDFSWFKAEITGQSLILFAGGIFLIYKSTHEIHQKVEGEGHKGSKAKTIAASFTKVIVQIVLIDMVFSFDSVLTAVGMTSGIEGALIIMIIAVIVSILIMMIFATPVSNFVNRYPTIQMLALSFLILIGFMLVTEGAHLSNAEVFNQHVGAIPKGYLYFAISFSLGVEALNIRMRKKVINS